MEKTLNMLTDRYDYANIIGSKPLRDILKLVMFKIMERLLSELRWQQRTWGIENLKSNKQNEYYEHSRNIEGFDENDESEKIFDLAIQLAYIAVWNKTVALQIERDILDQLSEDFIESKLQSNLILLKIEHHLEKQTKDYSNKTTTCQNATEGHCLKYLKKFHPLIQLPFEVQKLKKFRGLGFGTYLAYFSRLLANPAWEDSWIGNMFLMNKEMTEEEKEIRQYMNLVLNSLAQVQPMANISTLELVRYLHANPDEGMQISLFSGPLQDEFGCDIYKPPYKADYFWSAWKLYFKAHFAN